MTSMFALARLLPLLTIVLFAPCAGAQSDDYQEATKLFRAGQHAQALERVDNFLKTNSKEARARFLKGLILTEQGKPADAIKIFSKLTEDFPELPEPYNNLAVLYASQGQYDKARVALELAIRTHPSYATAHENLGDIYAKMASQAYDKALQLDKGNATAQTKLGMIKELFSRGGQGTKVSVVKPEIAVKSAPPSPPASKPSVASTTTTLAQAPATAPVPSSPAASAAAPPKTSPE